MAERRPVTAREIKSSVEGYQEMSDEAFARRFYSDRAELQALGVPLTSQRDEHTGEELYNMRSERYFLPELELNEEELAALQTALFLLEGKFAYAEPLRLALQNLALGRPGFSEAPTQTAMRVEVLDPEYSIEMQGRLSKLEAAISKQRTVKFPYWSISRDDERERTVNPLALFQDGRAIPREPEDLRREIARALKLARERHEKAPGRLAAESDGAEEVPIERPAAPVAPERFAVLQALLAYLLDQCGDEPEAEIPAADLVERFHIPPEELEEHLSLLNLVNFGGGCYAVYAELHDDTVTVDKELFGDTFRAPTRMTTLEARAIRLALEFVGPMIAADARSPLERVRAKLEETFGEFELAQTPEPNVQRAEEDLVATLSHGANERRLVEVDYLKEAEDEVSTHLVEPYALERRLPFWYVHTWDRTRDGERSFRLDRMRSARIQRAHFEPREGFDPHVFRDARPAKIWYSKQVARWEVEKGAHPLADGSAVAEKPVGSPEWLVGEILSFRGEAVVLDPPELRQAVSKRARELQRELGVSRVKVAS